MAFILIPADQLHLRGVFNVAQRRDFVLPGRGGGGIMFC